MISLFLGKVFIVDQLAGKIVWLPLVAQQRRAGGPALGDRGRDSRRAVAGTVGMRHLDV